MSRVCELTGKSPQVGHKVSHSNRKTKKRFLPNLNMISFHSEALDRNFRLRVTSHALRSVDHRGGFDAFLIKAKKSELSERVQKIKLDVEQAHSQNTAQNAA